MKPYALLILLFLVSGCRSSRNTTDTHVSDQSTLSQTNVRNEQISTKVSTLSVVSTATDTNIREYFKTTVFNPDGSVSEVQEAWRDTRRNELADSTGQRSDVSGINRNDSTSTDISNDIELKQTTQSHTDSRPVQGVEWLYIACVGGIVILIIILIIWLKIKK